MHIIKKAWVLHSIAFLQWRYMYPSSLIYNDEELKQTINTRIKQIYKEDMGAHQKEKSIFTIKKKSFFTKYKAVFT